MEVLVVSWYMGVLMVGYSSALAVACDFISTPEETPVELLFRLIETADAP
jgi:hypothetical protein